MSSKRTRAGVLAAVLLAAGLVGAMSGTASAVASRTSDGVALATAEPQATAAVRAAATTTPGSPGGAVDDWLVVVLGSIAAGGLGRGLWLLRGSAAARARTT